MSMQHRRLFTSLEPLLALLLVAALALPGLGSAGLLDPWEMQRVAVARAVAGPREVLALGSLDAATNLRSALGDAIVVRHLDGGLGKASAELAVHTAQGLVIDAEAGLGLGARAAILDARAAELDKITADNPGLAVAIVTDRPADEVQRGLARARAHGVVRGHQGGFWREAMPTMERSDELAPLLWGDETVMPASALPAWLDANVPSPWTTPVHQVDGRAVPAPLLDTWLVAASFRAFGPSEFAARLPGALMFLLSAWLLFASLRRRYGSLTAWCSAWVLATLPMALGAARVVSLESSASLGLLCVTLAVIGLGERDDAAAPGASGATPGPTPGPTLGLSAMMLLAGLGILLAGRGLGGLVMGAVIAVGAAVVRGRGRAGWAGAVVALGLLAAAAAWVLGDDTTPWLRAMRFTRMPFEGGLLKTEHDLSAIVGQIGFGLHPWGGLMLLGAGRLAFASDDDDRRGPAWLLGLGAGILVTMILLPNFSHVVAPIGPIAAAITALLLRDVLAGRVHGPLLALLVGLSVLLLHRETGKDASTLVRSLTWDPPFGGENAAFQWPEELKAPRLARAIGLLGVLGFALGLARPMAQVRRLVRALDGQRASIWLAGGALTVWALDVLISLGVRMDVLLRAEASRTGYDYDRVWLTIVSTRPEVIAGAVAFVAAAVAAIVAGLPAEHRLRRAVGKLGLLARPVVALAGLAAAAIGALVAGGMVHVAVAKAGWGAAIAAGLMQPAGWMPLLLLLPTLVWHVLAHRAVRGSDAVAAGPRRNGLIAWLLIAVGGVGVGASAAVGTWSYGLLIACWAAAVCVLGLAAGAPRPIAAFARTALAAATLTAATLCVVFAERLFVLVADGPMLLLRTLFAPDTGALLALAGLVLANHVATRLPRLETARFWLLWVAGAFDRPLLGVAAAMTGGLVLAGGVAFGLLPEMSVHFSQKHLLAAITAAGGDLNAQPPVAFKHAGAAGGKVLGSNFYTAALPTLASRDEVIAALSGAEAKVHVSDWGEQSRSDEVELGKGPRFAVVAKAEFSALNAAFRDKNEGRSIPVLDASSSRLVLAASALPADRKSANWLDDAILTEAQFAKLEGMQQIAANFDDTLELIGWRLGERSVRRGQKYHLELFWKVRKTPPVSYMLFMHPHPLHRDLWPLAVVPHTEAEGKRCTGCFQTNHWRVGDIVRFDVDQEVPLGTSAGPSEIILGLFDPLSDKRLPLTSATGPGVVKHNDNRVTIGRLLVR